MHRPKLGFRNQSACAQLKTCERVTRSVATASAEQRAQIQQAALNAATAAARASFDRVQTLAGELRAERARLQAALRTARAQATTASGWLALNLAGDPAAMLGVGLRLAAPREPQGRPAAPTQLRITPLPNAGAVKLRWYVPLRRCVFQVECRAEAWTAGGVMVRQSAVLRGLVDGTKYHFRVAAINAHGQGPWSQVISARVG